MTDMTSTSPTSSNESAPDNAAGRTGAPAHTMSEMVDALVSTFAVAHDGDSDERLAQTLVFNAGRLAWRMREQGVTAERKTSVSDVVTDADRAAERLVSGVLEKLRPEDGVLGEEGASRTGTSGRTWVIDPVDGTYNFTSGSDYYCSALALVEGPADEPERLILGAVHRPAMGYTWFGGPETAPVRDGKSLARLEDRPLAELSLATYIHPTWLADAAVRDVWLSVAGAPATLRMLGAGSVDLAGVAEGSVGAWMQHSVPAWDWLPGKALVEGVGGTARQVEAGGVVWSVAGNKRVVDEIEELLRGAQ